MKYVVVTELDHIAYVKLHRPEVRNAFNQGDELDILTFKGTNISLIASEIMDIAMKPVTRTRPSTLIRLPYVEGVTAFQLVRGKIK